MNPKFSWRVASTSLGMRATTAWAASLLAAGSAIAQFPRIDCPNFSRGGLTVPASGATRGDVYVIGQPIAGVVCALNDNTSRATFGVGFIPCLVKPTCDLTTTAIVWDDSDGSWDTATNWNPDIVPDNVGVTRYSVTIAPVVSGDQTPTVTLNRSPNITRLVLGQNSSIVVNASSGGSRLLRFVPGAGPTDADNATNSGLFEVLGLPAPNDNLQFTLQGMKVGAAPIGQQSRFRANGTSGFCQMVLFGSTIRGGLFEAIGQGQFVIFASTIDDATITSTGSGDVTFAYQLFIPGFGFVDVPGQVTVRGNTLNSTTVNVTNLKTLATDSTNTVMQGTGRVALRNALSANLGGPSGVITNGATVALTHQITGTGNIVGRLINNSLVDAETSGQTLVVNVPAQLPGAETANGAQVVNKNVMQASSGGQLSLRSPVENRGTLKSLAGSTLNIESTVTQSSGPNGGVIVADHGTVNLSAGGVRGGRLISIGGIININTNALFDCVEVPPGSISYVNVNNATLTANGGPGVMVTGGELTLNGQSMLRATDATDEPVGPIFVEPDAQQPGSVARLRVLGSSSVVAGSLTLGAGALLRVEAGDSAISVDDLFDNAMNVPLNWQWPGLGALRITGGTPASPAYVEVAGSNFPIPRLRIAAGANVVLMNCRDNGPGDVALYAAVEFEDSTGVLNRNGITIVPAVQSSQIVDNAVATPCSPPCTGDVNGDRAVNLSDLSFLLSNFGTTSGATLAMGDLTGDGAVNLTDLSTLLTNFGTSCGP